MSEYDEMEKTIHVQDGQIVTLSEENIGLSGDIQDLQHDLDKCNVYSKRWKNSALKRLDLLREKNIKLTRQEAVVEAANWILHLHHDVGKDGNPPSTEEWEACLEELKTALEEASGD